MDDGRAENVVGDSFRLRQILINMVGNAVKFTKSGQVAIKVAAETGFSNDVRLIFEISDTGIGIPLEQQENLFKAFHQLDSSITRRYGGSGLGLVICERLIKLMGGKICVHSTFGKGTTFTFDILCQKVEVADVARNEMDNSLLSGRSVLVVDDNTNSQKAFAQQLQKLGSNVTAVSSGQQALRLLKTRAQPDLVIIDMHMPDMDGIELGQLIKQSWPVPLILFGSPRGNDRKESPDLFSSVLNKPFRSSQLVKSVTDALRIERFAGKESKMPKLSEDFAMHYPYKILIAEDILMNQKLIIWVLSKLGYKPDLAGNGLEVLEMMQKESYDVILMDLQMPEMDGLEATRIIRETYGALPLIIALTANVVSEDRERCLMAGMNDYISKPINLELLTKSLRDLYNIHQKAEKI
jgi:CheY-like chemotaxis protein